jgi:hypothetical protein
LRRICGWERADPVPHESTFSRAFAEFAHRELPQFVHEALIRQTQQERLIGHIARDATAIEAREHYPETPAPAAARKKAPAAARKKAQAERKAARAAARAKRQAAAAAACAAPRKSPRGPHKRYKGGKRREVPASDTRLKRQRGMKLSAMLADLPRQGDLEGKKDSHGNTQSWRGYKLHLDVADGPIPISARLTSASVHDSQVAIPWATLSTQRVTYLYEVMDSAYDAYHIKEQSRELGHVPILDPKTPPSPRNPGKAIPPENKKRQRSGAEEERYKERTMVERVNGRLKDELGARNVRVRGAAKAMAHLLFGVLALTADQILRLV